MYDAKTLNILALSRQKLSQKGRKEYASSEFWRNYVPLCVLFRKWGTKGVFLRKRWGKCYRRGIGKFNFLAFIE